MHNKCTIYQHFIVLLHCTDCELPEDDTIASKRVGQCNIERYNKLLINCAFVGTLHEGSL